MGPPYPPISPFPLSPLPLSFPPPPFTVYPKKANVSGYQKKRVFYRNNDSNSNSNKNNNIV